MAHPGRETTDHAEQQPSLSAPPGHAFRALAESFNWKTAAISAILRALMFFFTNLRSGHNLALRATLVEATYAICASGVIGAITQRIRNMRPAWLTGLMIWLVLPASMLTAQFFVHSFFGTPHLKLSMIGSFCFAMLGTGFNWYAMRRGAFLVAQPASADGAIPRHSFAADLRSIPLLLWGFVSAIPRAILSRKPSNQ